MADHLGGESASAINRSRYPKSPEVPKKISILPSGERWSRAWRKNRVMAR